MATMGNSTCARFGGHDLQEAPFLLVKGTWFPSEFTISVCDGTGAWTGRATKDFVLSNASQFHLTESEYVDKIQYYFTKQQPNYRYVLKWDKNLSPELLCFQILPYELILRLETIEDSGPGVAVDMVHFLLDAYHRVNEELGRSTRAYGRELAAKELVLTSLREQLEHYKGSPKDRPNGHVYVEPDAGVKTVGGTSSRGKRKAGASYAGRGSRKRAAQALRTPEASPLLQKPPTSTPPILDFYEEQVLASRPLPLSALGYTQLKAGEELESSKEPSWLDKIEAKGNGRGDASNSDEQPVGARKAFLDRLSDVAVLNEDEVLIAKTGSGKRQGKSGGRSVGRPSKKSQAQPSMENSLDQVEDLVEKGIKSVDSIGYEVTSPLTTPAKQQRKTPATAKKLPKSSAKPKKHASGSRKKGKAVVDSESEESSEEWEGSPKLPALLPEVEEDRAITVQNAEFHDFDESRSEAAFAKEQFWALYDDQDGMPRFYGRIIGVQYEPFQVQVEWLEPNKPNLLTHGLVKTARLSPSCGDFTFGSQCSQDLPAFSHVIQVIGDAGMKVQFWPEKDEIWALYRHWDKKQAKLEDGNDEFYCEYDLVKVQSKFSPAEGVAVLPLAKVAGFKSLFTVDDEELTFQIPYRQIQARFSHSIPRHEMLGNESPGVPVGAWELDPASTPSEYLDSGAQDGNL